MINKVATAEQQFTMTQNFFNHLINLPTNKEMAA
jgi:hypothetical protein